jgi:predicted Fe-Mo cluster-binding NifX family protein
MKVAITVWEKRVSPVFDVFREALILEIAHGCVSSSNTERFDYTSPFQKIQRLVNLGIETLICGAISEPLNRELASRKIKVIGFIAGPVDDVVRAFIMKELPTVSLCMPGYYGKRTRLRGNQELKRGRCRQRN